MKSFVTSASCPARRMVNPMVESDRVAARCRMGTIQVARPMNTSVEARPMRMIASLGEGRLRKRDIATMKASTARKTARTRPAANCHTFDAEQHCDLPPSLDARHREDAFVLQIDEHHLR